MDHNSTCLITLILTYMSCQYFVWTCFYFDAAAGSQDPDLSMLSMQSFFFSLSQFARVA